jgi:hypothetical protein
MSNENPEQQISGALTAEEKEAIYRRAARRAAMRLAVYIHTAAYAVVNALLVFINLATDPSPFWAIWPMLGWGAGLAAHWYSTTRGIGLLDRLKEQEIARELELRGR